MGLEVYDYNKLLLYVIRLNGHYTGNRNVSPKQFNNSVMYCPRMVTKFDLKLSYYLQSLNSHYNARCRLECQECLNC